MRALSTVVVASLAQVMVGLWGGGIDKATAAEPVPAKQIADYFPLVEKSEYSYHGKFNDKEDDKTIVVKAAQIQDTTVYFFADAQSEDKGTDIIGSNSFGLGVYVFEDMRLFTYEAFWRSDVNFHHLRPAMKQQFLPSPLDVGSIAEVRHEEKKLVLTVMKPESVQVPAGTFDDCLKISVKEVWPTVSYQGYVWLAKGVGVVKRQYTTGRVDELTSFKIAKREADKQP